MNSNAKGKSKRDKKSESVLKVDNSMVETKKKKKNKQDEFD